ICRMLSWRATGGPTPTVGCWVTGPTGVRLEPGCWPTRACGCWPRRPGRPRDRCRARRPADPGPAADRDGTRPAGRALPRQTGLGPRRLASVVTLAAQAAQPHPGRLPLPATRPGLAAVRRPPPHLKPAHRVSATFLKRGIVGLPALCSSCRRADEGEPMARPPLSARPPTDAAEERTRPRDANARHAPASLIQRARIITASWDGASVPEPPQQLGCPPKTVYKWLPRFNAPPGRDGLGDLPRAGLPRRITETERGRIIALARSQ